MAEFSTKRRRTILDRLRRQEYDVLIIGGGITGAGIALDARSRGMKTALVEMQDFAAGTSSRSTKLVHGGLRYLKQFEVGMVAEVGKERAVVYENAPHVTTPEWMLLPIYEGGTFGTLSTSVGLAFYDFLAGVKRDERRVMLSRGQALAKEPLLRKDGLKGGGHYVEYRTDDARLTIEVLKKAAEFGADAINYVQAESFLYDEGRIVGVRAADRLGRGSVDIRARAVVNATGPWSDALRELDGSKQGKTLHLTKGVHLVFDGRRFPLRQAVYFDTRDGRMVFAIPRDGKTYVGTTDTNYRNDIAHPRMTARDRDYLLDAVNAMFPAVGLGPEDVESSWAGLRPLVHEEGKDPSEISRKDEIFLSPSGLITIAGGKLTGYRKMAETIVNGIADRFAAEGAGAFPACQTRHLPLSGGEIGGSRRLPGFVRDMTGKGVALGLSPEAAEAIARRYGTNAERVFAWISRYGEEGAESGLPVDIWITLMYAIDGEMAARPADFFIRRTGSLFFDRDWATRWRSPVADAMAAILGWTEAEKQANAEEFDRLLTEAVEPAETD